jgi:hypothetical protein
MQLFNPPGPEFRRQDDELNNDNGTKQEHQPLFFCKNYGRCKEYND